MAELSLQTVDLESFFSADCFNPPSLAMDPVTETILRDPVISLLPEGSSQTFSCQTLVQNGNKDPFTNQVALFSLL